MMLHNTLNFYFFRFGAFRTRISAGKIILAVYVNRWPFESGKCQPEYLSVLEQRLEVFGPAFAGKITLAVYVNWWAFESGKCQPEYP